VTTVEELQAIKAKAESLKAQRAKAEADLEAVRGRISDSRQKLEQEFSVSLEDAPKLLDSLREELAKETAELQRKLVEAS
jgi:chromosome segregation ATPase